jgi:hypothetical protein
MALLHSAYSAYTVAWDEGGSEMFIPRTRNLNVNRP